MRQICWIGLHDYQELQGYYYFPKDGNPREGMLQRVCLNCGKFQIARVTPFYGREWRSVEDFEAELRDNIERAARAKALTVPESQ